jgi:hypothetical protein
MAMFLPFYANMVQRVVSISLPFLIFFYIHGCL